MASGADPAATLGKPAPLKVSVVVPVYNPGDHIDGLLASLRRQSLSRDELEVVFVDDESTDGTAERLDTLAAETSNMRVIHIPRSGWPGRPRNIGLEAAAGEYVQFVDNDDELGGEALERLYRYARANSSDVVIGREVRTHGWFAYGLALFAQNHPRISLDDPRLLGPLTPHKMFRREFLLEHAIRFPEAPGVFEDYAFNMHAYLVADVISVLSDYPCYVWKHREDQSNAGVGSPGRSYADTIALILRHTDAGPFRDRMLAYWYQRRILSMLNHRWTQDAAEVSERRFSRWCRRVEEHFPAQIDPHLPALMRTRSSLLRAGELDRLLALARQRVRLVQGPAAVSVRRRDARLTVDVWLSWADGTPVQAEAVDGRLRWRPPIDLGAALDPSALDVTADLRDVEVKLVARRRKNGDAILLAATASQLDEGGTSRRLGATVTGRVAKDAQPPGARRLYPGTWDLFVGLSVAGWSERAPLEGPPSAKPGGALGRPVVLGDHEARLSTTPHGTVSLAVARRQRSGRRAMRRPRTVVARVWHKRGGA
jgi:glycosyltransferase involved in cell wall biosynthesis